MDNPTLTWECPLCGLETPKPEEHLKAHGLTIEKVVAIQEEARETAEAMARLFLAEDEMSGTCPFCGQIDEDALLTNLRIAKSNAENILSIGGDEGEEYWSGYRDAIDDSLEFIGRHIDGN